MKPDSIDLIHEAAINASVKHKTSEVELLHALEEVRKKLVYIHKGYRSLYEYATKALGLTEGLSYALQVVLRKSEEVPELKQYVAAGLLTLQSARRVAPVLNKDNKSKWLERARVLPQRELERAVAIENPKAAVPTKERAIAANVNQLQVCMSDRGLEAIREVQKLMSKRERRVVELGDVIERLADFYFEKTDPVVKAEKALAKAKIQPNATANDAELFRANKQSVEKRPIRKPIPAEIRHRVYFRDRGCCTFRRENGERCNSKMFVEIHHIKPVAQGGTNDLKNLTSLCSVHHKYEHNDY